MCLTLEPNAGLHVAQEDIICYKLLLATGESNDLPIRNGDKFIAIIKGIKVEGVIRKTDFDEIFLCHNNSKLNGKRTRNRMGFHYSWIVDRHTTSIIIEGEENGKYV